MSQPTPYNKATTFANETFDQDFKDKLDVELHNIETAIDETQTSLALVQRDDGALKNGVVTKDSLSTGLYMDILSDIAGTDISAVTAEVAGYAAQAEDARDAAQDAQVIAEGYKDDAQGYATDAQGYAQDAQDAIDSLNQTTYEATATVGQSQIVPGFSFDNVAGNVRLYIDGVIQPPSAYTLPNTTTIALSSALSGGEDILVFSVDFTAAPSAPLYANNNLSDIINVSTARTNLELGGSALLNVGTSAGTVCAGDDARLDSSGVYTLAVFDSFLNQIGLGRASGAVPSGFMHLFLTDELATKTGATYNATGDYYINQAAASGTKTALTGGMFSVVGGATDYTVASLANGILAESAGFAIFSGTAAGAGTLIDKGSGQTFDVSSLRLWTVSGAGSAATFNAQISPDGTNWTTVGSFTTVSNSWAGITVSETAIKGRYLRVVTSGVQSGNTTFFSELEVYEFLPATSMTLVPTAITAGSAPNTVDFYLLHRAIDATALNTDIKARVSRDNGSNWSGYVTLADVCQYDASYRLLKGTADLSALASGTSVKWEVTTLNSTSQRVRAAAMILNG